MNLRKNIFTALLIAMGYILHQVIPGTIGNMKLDMMLSFVVVSLLINRDFKSTLLTALLSGGITALTTTFPGGQLPNIIDKLVTCIFIYLLLKVLEGLKLKHSTAGLAAFLGTLVSGAVFLYTAYLMVGLPAPFSVLFAGIVLPASFANTFVTLLAYNAVKTALRATGLKYI